jgi:hypothetical protein
MTPILARTLSWVEVANGASIIFDLRITAVAGDSEAETHKVGLVRIAEAFLLEKGREGGSQAYRHDAQPT